MNITLSDALVERDLSGKVDSLSVYAGVLY